MDMRIKSVSIHSTISTIVLICGMFGLTFTSCAATKHSRKDNKVKAVILETKLVSKEPGQYLIYNREIDKNGHLKTSDPIMEPNRYLGWPTIAKTESGELLIVYSGDRDAHVCPWGKTQIIRSQDNGKTWSKPETINNTPLDDRDAGIIQTNKGTILVSWFTSLAYANPSWKSARQKYARVAEKIPDELKKQWLGNWVRRSEDGGKTWKEPSRTSSTAPHGPIQLRDGRLLYIGNATWENKPALVAEQSLDDGISWQVIATFNTENGSVQGLSEPHVVELKNGKIIAMFRNESKGSEKYLLQSESFDGGKTWTTLHKTNIWGYPPHLIELNNGWLLVSYGHRRQPFGIRACISKDGGKTWDIDNEIILSDAYNTDLGYPASVQLEDGSILTVFYKQDKENEPTSIFTTHWKID
jgi:Neuraminidase (sialidase)